MNFKYNTQKKDRVVKVELERLLASQYSTINAAGDSITNFKGSSESN